MKTSNKGTASAVDFLTRVIRREIGSIATSYSIILVLLGGVVAYGFLYNFMYRPNLVRSVPTVVVDMSQSELGRRFTRLVDASPATEVTTVCTNFKEAERLMRQGTAEGIIYIPFDFRTRLGQGRQAVFITYINTAEFLNFEAVQSAVMGAMEEIDTDFRPEMAVFLPPDKAERIIDSGCIDPVGTALFNTSKGYGDYLLPSVLIIIIFQTLLMTIGMISGGERRRRTILFYASDGVTAGRMALTVLGKTAVYFVLYALFALFLTGFIPLLFGLPDTASLFDKFVLLIPYLLATSFCGLAASVFFTDSDSPLLMIAFFSVGLIFLAGVSFPLELMPAAWRAAHYLFPAAPAALAFVKLNSMGASLNEISAEYTTLWCQAAAYFPLAVAAYARNVRLALRSDSVGRRA